MDEMALVMYNKNTFYITQWRKSPERSTKRRASSTESFAVSLSYRVILCPFIMHRRRKRKRAKKTSALIQFVGYKTPGADRLYN